MLPNISIIVPAKNEEKVIKNCIESLLNLDYPKDKLEVLVSIDGSTDRTLEICKKYEPKIRIIKSKPKKCKAEALNEVIPLTKGEIIGIFDADCIVDNNCLKYIAESFADKKVCGVSGVVRSVNCRTIISKTISLETNLTSFLEYTLSKIGANPHFFGKNMFIRKDVLEKIGGFGTYSFIEDIELSLKMKRLKYKVSFQPKAIAWQEEPSNILSYIKQRERWCRGILRLRRVEIKKSVKNRLSDLMHTIPYYISPFNLIIGTLYLISNFLNHFSIFRLPLLLLLTLNIFLIILSSVYHKSIRNLLYLPIWFVLSNIEVIIFFKSFLDEELGKEMEWFRADRY